jgi:hypothetical protein
MAADKRLRRLGCPLWLAEHPCTSAFSGRWNYTTRRDTTVTRARVP